MASQSVDFSKSDLLARALQFPALHKIDYERNRVYAAEYDRQIYQKAMELKQAGLQPSDFKPSEFKPSEFRDRHPPSGKAPAGKVSSLFDPAYDQSKLVN